MRINSLGSGFLGSMHVFLGRASPFLLMVNPLDGLLPLKVLDKGTLSPLPFYFGFSKSIYSFFKILV